MCKSSVADVLRRRNLYRQTGHPAVAQPVGGQLVVFMTVLHLDISKHSSTFLSRWMSCSCPTSCSFRSNEQLTSFTAVATPWSTVYPKSHMTCDSLAMLHCRLGQTKSCIVANYRRYKACKCVCFGSAAPQYPQFACFNLCDLGGFGVWTYCSCVTSWYTTCAPMSHLDSQ